MTRFSLQSISFPFIRFVLWNCSIVEFQFIFTNWILEPIKITLTFVIILLSDIWKKVHNWFKMNVILNFIPHVYLLLCMSLKSQKLEWVRIEKNKFKTCSRTEMQSYQQNFNLNQRFWFLKHSNNWPWILTQLFVSSAIRKVSRTHFAFLIENREQTNELAVLHLHANLTIISFRNGYSRTWKARYRIFLIFLWN